jgi:hypothetical protein
LCRDCASTHNLVSLPDFWDLGEFHMSGLRVKQLLADLTF